MNQVGNIFQRIEQLFIFNIAFTINKTLSLEFFSEIVSASMCYNQSSFSFVPIFFVSFRRCRLYTWFSPRGFQSVSATARGCLHGANHSQVARHVYARTITRNHSSRDVSRLESSRKVSKNFKTFNSANRVVFQDVVAEYHYVLFGSNSSTYC